MTHDALRYRVIPLQVGCGVFVYEPGDLAEGIAEDLAGVGVGGVRAFEHFAQGRLEPDDRAARSAINPANLVWVVVGDAAKIRPQLDKLGMPIEVVEAP